MKIRILSPELFVQHRNQIGMILFTNEQNVYVNFFTGDNEHKKVHRNELGSPSMSDLEVELISNDSLRHLASDNDCIEVSHQDSFDYIKYASSHN
jgi:hypothetical protein|tara:strand:- start:650 stop:934 length:285 start_codon:yes stop_codon:yes gene_type:complete